MQSFSALFLFLLLAGVLVEGHVAHDEPYVLAGDKTIPIEVEPRRNLGLHLKGELQFGVQIRHENLCEALYELLLRNFFVLVAVERFEELVGDNAWEAAVLHVKQLLPLKRP